MKNEQSFYLDGCFPARIYPSEEMNNNRLLLFQQRNDGDCFLKLEGVNYERGDTGLLPVARKRAFRLNQKKKKSCFSFANSYS